MWTYHTRPGEESSLLKIQKIEASPEVGQIYHITVIGLHLKNPRMAPIIAHAPVSQQVLDQSVVRTTEDPGGFPSADPGIKEWRNAEGGVFTIPVARIVQILDDRSATIGD